MYRWLVVTAVRFLMFCVCRIEVIGRENLPEKGPVLVCSNHVSLLDSPILYLAINKDMWGIGAYEYRFNPLVVIFRLMGRVILIKRGQSDKVAIRKAQTVLKAGHYLGMAPEGTRSKKGKLIIGKTGAAYLAYTTGSVIIPVGIVGSTNIFKNIFRKRTVVIVNIGKPIKVPNIDRKSKMSENGEKVEDLLQHWTDKLIMRAIANLLPKDMRGYYG